MNKRAELTRVVWGCVVMAALAVVFWAYTRPAFLASLVDDLWSCF